jgi:hypothetical protein
MQGAGNAHCPIDSDVLVSSRRSQEWWDSFFFLVELTPCFSWGWPSRSGITLVHVTKYITVFFSFFLLLSAAQTAALCLAVYAEKVGVALYHYCMQQKTLHAMLE